MSFNLCEKFLVYVTTVEESLDEEMQKDPEN